MPNTQRDGRPAEYSWRPVLNAAKFGSCPLLECRAVMLLIGERKVNFARGKIPLRGNSRRKCIYSLPAQVMAKHRAKFGWPPMSDVAAVTLPRCETR